MCLHEAGERPDRIAPGASSSSMLLFRVGGGKDGSGVVSCRTPPPTGVDKDAGRQV